MSSTHSIYKEFDTQMKALIRTYANDNPAPRFGTISNISPDEQYVDVNIGDGTLKAVERFGGKPILDKRCIVSFVNGNFEEPVAICGDYEKQTLCYNLLNNGCFQKVNDTGFEDWTGGTVSTLNYFYNKSSARLLPKTNMISAYIDITCLEDKELGELSEIMLFYYYIGEISIEIIDKETQQPIIIAPESLGYKKEVLEPVDSWHYARTHFLLRNHKEIAVKFINTSETESAYIDGVRIWKPDFEFWYPSEKDENEIGDMLNKNYLTILKDPASWKLGVTKIINDIDTRLKNLEKSDGGGGASVDHTHEEYLKYNDTIYNSEHLGGRSSGDFALANHNHTYSAYITPFTIDGAGTTFVNIKFATNKNNMLILNKTDNVYINSVSGTEVSINATNDDNNVYYLLYWLSAGTTSQLGTSLHTNDIEANVGETVNITSSVNDENGNPVNTGEVEYNTGG